MQQGVLTPGRSSGPPALPVIGTALVAGGLFLLALVAWSLLNPGPPPYRYELVDEGVPDDFAELGLEQPSDLIIRKYEIHSDGIDEPVAVLHLANPSAADPVLLEWHNNTVEPVLRLLPDFAETRRLADGIARHVPAEAQILGWWDTSQQIDFLSDTEVLLGENLMRPLLIPAAWQDRNDTIEALEREFWSAPSSPDTRSLFEQFSEALLLDEASGIAELRRLAGNRQTYIVAHVFDAYKLGAMKPDRLGIGYKDFPPAGNIHGLAKHVKEWLATNGYESYTTTTVTGSEATRVFFFTDPEYTRTLVARMLPFTTSNPFAVDGLRVVYQDAGYWVYRLTPSEPQG